MRHYLILALLVVGSTQCAFAQSFDDASVCARLVQSSQIGLHIAHPTYSTDSQLNRRAICEPSSGFCIAPVNGRVIYDPAARFYFLSPNGGLKAKESVWHIRTQTRASKLSGADFAFVYRPSVRTRCSPNSPLDAFFFNRRLVPLNRYMDHHRAPTDPVRPDIGLGRYFHFSIQDPPDTQQCVRTDDRVFGNLRALYGFDGVIRTEQRVARLFLFTGTAVADVATRHAGLSSEFAYHDGSGPVCFGFTVPVPTISGNFHAAQNWRPELTSIVIKRLRGRQVFEAMQRTVNWAQ